MESTPSNVEVVAEIASTNTTLAQRAKDGAAHGATLVAEHQQAARARLDRSFVTPKHAAGVVSWLLRPDVPPERFPWLTIVGGLAVVDTCAEFGVRTQLKWPNDALVMDAEPPAKIAGILSEQVLTADGSAVVLGIGLNVSVTREELPPGIGTSIWLETGVEPDRTQVVATLIQRWWHWYDLWAAADGVQALREAYLGQCATLGQQVRAELPGAASIAGEATGVDQYGRLLIDVNGVQQCVSAGDIVHLRPAE